MLGLMPQYHQRLARGGWGGGGRCSRRVCAVRALVQTASKPWHLSSLGQGQAEGDVATLLSASFLQQGPPSPGPPAPLSFPTDQVCFESCSVMTLLLQSRPPLLYLGSEARSWQKLGEGHGPGRAEQCSSTSFAQSPVRSERAESKAMSPHLPCRFPGPLCLHSLSMGSEDQSGGSLPLIL